jgi:PTS system N-acetylglucosamine-specific IIC component
VSAEALQVVLGPIADQVAEEIRQQLRAPAAPGAVGPQVIAALLSALGGRENVRETEAVASSRLRVKVADGKAVDEAAIRALGLRGVARPADDLVHLVVGLEAEQVLTSLRALVT